MKYINVQTGDKCINVYQISLFYIRDLSIYAKINDKKILLGSYNTKEDAHNEYNNILNSLSNKSRTVYHMSTEDYWIKQRMEIEINDMFQEEPDIPTMDYEEDNDYPDDFIENEEPERIDYSLDEEEYEDQIDNE